MEELDSLPEELDNLFEHIFKSLRNPARRRACQTFALLAESKKHNLPVSLYAYSFLDEYERDPEFAMADAFPQLHEDDMARDERNILAEKKLLGWCKGLVESNGDSNLEYTHRSVPEYLHTSTINAERISITERFNTVDAISQLFLAEARLQYPDPTFHIKQTFGRFMTSLLRMRHNNGLDKPPYSFLDCLGSLLNPFVWDLLDQKRTATRHLNILNGSGVFTIVCTIGNEQGHSINEIPAPLYLMTYFGYHEYPMWKILHDPTTIDTTSKILMLAYCCTCPYRTLDLETTGAFPDISVLLLLLERGFLSPNTKTHLRSIHAIETTDLEPNTQLTVWQNCILQFSEYYYVGTHPGDDYHGKIFEAFLQYKPDLDFSLSLYCGDNFIFKLNLGDVQLKLLLPWAGGCSNRPVFENLSPREWVKLSKLKNKESLLRLIDSQIMHSTSDIEETADMLSPVEFNVKDTNFSDRTDQWAPKSLDKFQQSRCLLLVVSLGRYLTLSS